MKKRKLRHFDESRIQPSLYIRLKEWIDETLLLRTSYEGKVRRYFHVQDRIIVLNINCSVLFRLHMVALHFVCRRYLPSCTSQLCLSYKVLSHKVQAEHVEHITVECFATVELVLSIAHVQCLNCSMFVLGARQSSTLAA